jgi:hypothetical protein
MLTGRISFARRVRTRQTFWSTVVGLPGRLGNGWLLRAEVRLGFGPMLNG